MRNLTQPPKAEEQFDVEGYCQVFTKFYFPNATPEVRAAVRAGFIGGMDCAVSFMEHAASEVLNSKCTYGGYLMNMNKMTQAVKAAEAELRREKNTGN